MIENMEANQIYRITFSGVELVCRYKKSDTCRHYFFSELHYWKIYETFKLDVYCVKAGIVNIADASKCEKFNLIRHENI